MTGFSADGLFSTVHYDEDGDYLGYSSEGILETDTYFDEDDDMFFDSDMDDL